MQRREKTAIAALLIAAITVAGLDAWQFFLHPNYLESQRYPSVVDPSQAYMMPNGTLYLGVYNSWTQPVSLDSVQVARLPGVETPGMYSLVDYTNSAAACILDGSVEIHCCAGGGNEQVVAKSTGWGGGGEVPAGGGALLRFHPPSSSAPGAAGSYFLAIGSQWFPSSNLGTFTTTIDVNNTLPSFVPIHAVVYPNESMRVGIVSTGEQGVANQAEVFFTGLLIHRPVNADYSVVGLGGNWYRLAGGSALPPYMLVSENSAANPNSFEYLPQTSFTIQGMTDTPLNFTESMVTQVPPIVAPTAQMQAGSSSAGSYTSSYGVQWQIPLNGSSTYEVPITIYGGTYWIDASEGITAEIGTATVLPTASFNSTFYCGIMTITVDSAQKGGSLSVTLGYGIHFQLSQTTTSNTVVASITETA